MDSQINAQDLVEVPRTLRMEKSSIDASATAVSFHQRLYVTALRTLQLDLGASLMFFEHF